MKTILPIVWANLRKGTGQALSLLVFALIAALLLHLGLLLMLGFASFFDQRSEELHTPHYVIYEEKRLFEQSQIEYLRNYPGVTEVESERVISFSANTSYGGGKMPADFIFLDVNGTRNMNNLLLIEGAAPSTDKEICLPYVFRAGGGYQLGDSLTLTAEGRTFSFVICGFTEDIMFGSVNNQMYQVYVTSAGFSALSSQLPRAECMMLRARLQDPLASEDLFNDCARDFFFQTNHDRVDSAYVGALEWVGVKLMRTMMPGITAAVLTIFATLIVLVSLLVIRFRIRNSIEENITDIGALKAVGYTGSQLLWATILQFCLVALVGVIMGIGVSYALLPPISHVLEVQTALQWRQGFDLLSSVLTFAFILAAVFVVTWLSAWRIRRLQPLTALRQGLSTHTFRKNRLPLERSRGTLTLLLALKSAIQSKSQMVMTYLIVAAVTLAAAAGLSIYINLGVHPDSFAKLLGGEMPDSVFVLNDPDDMDELRHYVENSGQARKQFTYWNMSVMINNVVVSSIIAEDYSLFEGSLLYEGRYPKHENEVCVSGTLSRIIDAGIGDTIRIKEGIETAEYLVVGLIQVVNNGGIACAMTMPGLYRIQSDFQARELYVYLTDSTMTEEFMRSVETRFNDRLFRSINIYELMNAQLSMYGDIFFVEAVVLFVVTILVIFMVLYLMLKTVILRQRRELGIQKALGFTTFQLMHQFALYYIPVIALGVATGGLLGILGFNSMFVALVQSLGIMTASMPPSVELTILMCIILVVLAYVFALCIAWRIRKVSAYSLVSER